MDFPNLKIGMKTKQKIDPQALLNSIESVVNKLFENDYKGIVYMNVYFEICNLVLKARSGQKLYEKLQELFSRNINKICIKTLNIIDPIVFLKSIQSAWNIAYEAINTINNLCYQLNTDYIALKSLKELPEMGFMLFYNEVLINTGNFIRLSFIVINEIIEDRNSELCADEKPIISDISRMLIVLSKSLKLPIFENCLGKPYLIDTGNFYQTESCTFIKEMTIVNYLINADSIMKCEIERSKYLSDSETTVEVQKMLNKIFIIDQANTIFDVENDGICKWLKELLELQISKEKLCCIYRIFNSEFNKPDIFTTFVEAIKNIIKSEGNHFISETDLKNKFIKLIENLLLMLEKYNKILSNCFNNNDIIKTRIEKAFIEFINQNDTTLQALAYFSHYFLSKKEIQVNGLTQDQILDGIVTIFKYLYNKDTFGNLYIQYIEDRLISNTTTNDENEKCLISKFKIECGTNYTDKMETRFKDMQQSNEEFQQFLDSRKSISEKLQKSFNVRVLTSWQLCKKTLPIQIPNELMTMRKMYTDFYMNKHTGRALHWKDDKGKLEIVARFPNDKITYFFTMNLYQGVILLLFNDFDKLSLNEIQEKLTPSECKFPLDELNQIISIFATIRLVLCEQIKDTSGKTLTFVKINNDFKNKNTKIIFPALQKSTEKIISQDQKSIIDENIMKERKIKLSEIMTKIMKSRKRERHDILIMDTIKQASTYFKTNTEFVKNIIEEYLIYQEIIERDPTDVNYYIYKP